MTSRRTLFIALGVLAAVLLVGRAVATTYVDYRWYAAMGAAAVWRAAAWNSFLLRAGSALIGGLLVFLNLYAVRQSVVSVVLPRRVGNIEIGEEVPGRYLMTAVVTVSLLFAVLFFGSIPRDAWVILGQVRYGRSFSESDPFFLLDLGFWTYWLPLETALYYWAIIALVLLVALVVFLYALTPSLRWERGGLRVSTWVRRHLGVLGGVLIVLLAWSYRLDAYGALSYGSGPEGAFTWVDHKVMIPTNLALAMLSLVAALMVVVSCWRGQMKLTFGVVTAVLVLSLLLRQAVPVIAVRLAPETDPARREQKYLATRQGFTRRAYDADAVQAASPTLGFASLADAARGVPVWDPAAAARAIDRAHRGGETVGELGWQATPSGPVLVAVERPAPSDSSEGGGWTLERVMTGATDDRGAPMHMPASATDDEQPIARALVADGESGYAVVSDTSERLPASEIDSWRSRLAHAWSAQNFRLLVSDLPHPHPRIVLRRDVRERVRALAPWFEQGHDIGTLVRGDSVFWLVELYVASGSYPLSQHIGIHGADWSYYRHAATALVQAATGRVTLVADAALDPMAQSWVSRFPSLFTPRSALAPELAAALPPPAEGAMAQAASFVRVGPRVPMGEGDPPVGWRPLHVVTHDDGVDSLDARGGPTLLLLPDGRWALPLAAVDDATRSVQGLLIATGGAQPAVHWMPLAESLRVRWTTMRERLARAPDPAPQGRAVAGRVRVVPLAGGRVAWAQPLYAWRADGAPTVARVGVLEGDSLRTGRTFADAVGTAVHAPSPSTPATPEEFRARVERLYDESRAALRAGDLGRFGATYDSLGRLLGRPPRSP